MKLIWLITRSDGEANIHPKKDILPHMLHINCPCRPKIIYLHDEDAIEIDLEGNIDTITAHGETTVVMHSYRIDELKETNN